MSFTFHWPRFSEQFHYDAIQMLNNALNKGNKPPIIADKIEVVELEMGREPPELEIRDIGELTTDQFRGIFRLTYNGDAHLVLKTKVQANPLNHKQPDIHLLSGSRGMLAAKQPLVVPMLLRLSHFKLNSYVVLVVSKQKGITLVFKTDPLQSVDINSTFDSIAVIQKFIQREIEGQLRQMFREDLPGIIHRLSQQWVKAKVEAPYLKQESSPLPPRPPPSSVMSSPSPSTMHLPPPLRPGVTRPLRSRTTSNASSTNMSRRPPVPSTPPPPPPTPDVPELESFDPTYGLRPEGLPSKSIFRGFSSLFAANKGLADLTEEPTESVADEDDVASFDMIDWGDNPASLSPPPSTQSPESVYGTPEFETIPAVGGGTITRPRIYHSQSMIQSPSRPGTPRTRLSSAERLFGSPSSLLSRRAASFAELATPHERPLSFPMTKDASDSYFPRTSYHQPLSPRSPSPDSMEEAHESRSSESLQTPPPSHLPSHSNTKPNTPLDIDHISSPLDTLHPPSPTFSHSHDLDEDPKIVLRPGLNISLQKFSTLSHSNHTLSPYTRSVEHFTVRSVPPRAHDMTRTLSDRPPPKAKRKRTFYLGGKPKDGQNTAPVSGASSMAQSPMPNASFSPLPSSEFDLSDMDRYFRNNDGR